MKPSIFDFFLFCLYIVLMPLLAQMDEALIKLSNIDGVILFVGLNFFFKLVFFFYGFLLRFLFAIGNVFFKKTLSKWFDISKKSII